MVKDCVCALLLLNKTSAQGIEKSSHYRTKTEAHGMNSPLHLIITPTQDGMNTATTNGSGKNESVQNERVYSPNPSIFWQITLPNTKVPVHNITMPTPRVVPRNITVHHWSSPQFIPTVTVNGTDWHGNPAATQLLINGPIMVQEFAIKYPIGEIITHGLDRNSTQSRLDFLIDIYPSRVEFNFNINYWAADQEQQQANRKRGNP